ncbi:MAG: endonuclease/exonuclease/phosphatase family protein [Gammaproteobacteria bacterium]|nr:endonuclease/exonuclease/phosphatase family protein [Gammaproteobacteria bacterium]
MKNDDRMATARLRRTSKRKPASRPREALLAHIRIATYNVRGGVGLDQRRLPSRQLEILRRIGADCIGLQEFVNYPALGRGTLLDHWSESLGMQARFTPCFRRGGQEFGNAVLTRFPIVDCTEHDISAPGGRTRAALDLLVATGARTLQVICLHCAVRARPRALQRHMIAALAEHKRGDTTVILGDFNEWRSRNRTFHELRNEFATGPALPTFPALAPVFPLDRIWVHPRDCLLSTHVYSHRPAAYASDHLPVVASVAL